jgi:hypothetical protein
MQQLRQLNRVVRGEIKDAVKQAGDLAPERVREIRTLAKGFRQDLRDSYLEAGRGRDFELASILEDVGQAARDLADGLRALRGADVPAPAPESGDETGAIAVTADEPGAILSVLA